MSRTAVLEDRVAAARVVDITSGLDELSTADLVAGLGAGAVAEALRGKDEHDAVPMTVWWLVADALRRSLSVSGVGVARDRAIAAAVVAVERASWALAEDGPLILSSVGPSVRRAPTVHAGDPVRALRRAQVLVARLVVSPAPTSPTLLQVRLERLGRALVDTLQTA